MMNIFFCILYERVYNIEKERNLEEKDDFGDNHRCFGGCGGCSVYT